MTDAATKALKNAALKNGKRVLKDRMDMALRLARELETRLKTLDEAEDRVTHSTQFNWAVNDVNNFLLGLGMAELCRVQAELEVAHHLTQRAE